MNSFVLLIKYIHYLEKEKTYVMLRRVCSQSLQLIKLIRINLIGILNHVKKSWIKAYTQLT